MQSTQTSASVAFRALVMLAFVVGVSVIAFSGSAHPEKARKLLEKIWPVITSVVSSAKANILAEVQSNDSNPQNTTKMPGQNYLGMTNLPMPLNADNQAVPLHMRRSGSSQEYMYAGASNVVPADYQSVVETRITPSGQNSQKETNPFISIQDRLRQLGATYYLLETWGNQRQFFRFYCQMSVGGNASYTHYFEATNADPMAAMGDVLRQVEAWRFGSEGTKN
jgi:hypothetical protein